MLRDPGTYGGEGPTRTFLTNGTPPRRGLAPEEPDGGCEEGKHCHPQGNADPLGHVDQGVEDLHVCTLSLVSTFQYF
jgi:hypothetical protein